MAEPHTNKGQGTHNQGNANKGGQNFGNQNQGNQHQGGQGGSQGNQGGVAGVAQMARDAASTATKTATEQAQHAAENLGGGMRSVAGSIREHAPQGMLGTAAGTVADTLESGGRYLEQEGFSGMAEDVVSMVRRYPIPSMLICAGIGFCLGRMLTSGNNHSGSF